MANSGDISFYIAMGILLWAIKSSYKLLFTIGLAKGGNLNFDGGNLNFDGGNLMFTSRLPYGQPDFSLSC